MKDDEHSIGRMGRLKLEDGAVNGASAETEWSASNATPEVREAESPSPATSLDGIKSRSDSAGTPNSIKPPTSSRKASRKSAIPQARLCGDFPDVTAASCEAFQVIRDCLYGSKHMGSTDNDAFDCDCRDEWHNGENVSCGEDSDCINRATKVECAAGTGNCKDGCQNQRFQRKQYANVSVIKTEKKGFGLRTDEELQANDFIFEYIGEVINEPTFRRRMLQYDDEGIKHFYFMSLTKSEFVDATKRGNLGRFCNHSCNPNCYVDKWVVGDKLRMGIFALRKVRAGEELVFNYNVDRYGAEPQPCYCGEPNCVGFIGGKTQTERATKLPIAIVEALGIDAGDGWDTTVAKKPRKKRADEDDEEYVNSIQARTLEDEDARKVMAALMQCKEKWIAVKLLERIQQCTDERIIHIVMRMHAYQIMKTVLNTFIEDYNLVLQVLSILDMLPRLTRNKIHDSKIEATIEGLADSEHQDVASQSKTLLEAWSKLELGYRIRRRKVDPNAPAQSTLEERRGGHTRDEEQPRQDVKTASPQTIDAPRGPRSNAPQRNNAYYFNARQRRLPFHSSLPQGWFSNTDANGKTYFYDKQGASTWKRPTQPAPEAAKGPSKAMQEQAAIQSIIDRVTKENTTKQATPHATPQATPTAESTTPDAKREKWRALPVDKQMKIYENTLFPTVKHVLDKFRHKLPKEELKRLGKEIAKKLVASDFKNNRVDDPTAALSDKQSSKIKKFVKDFLDRAVEKYNEHQRRKAKRGEDKSRGDDAASSSGQQGPGPMAGLDTEMASPTSKESPAMVNGREDIDLSDAEGGDSPDNSDRKRKREAEVEDSAALTPMDGPDMKRLREEDGSEQSPPPPPPPPPPPESALEDAMTSEQLAMREQEEALMKENEEAQRLEDEATKTKFMEDATKDLQRELATAGTNGQAGQAGPQTVGQDHNDDGSGSATLGEHSEARKQEVLSH